MNNVYKTPESELEKTPGGIAGNFELYKASGIGVATFFGTPIAGGILMSITCIAFCCSGLTVLRGLLRGR